MALRRYERAIEAATDHALLCAFDLAARRYLHRDNAEEQRRANWSGVGRKLARLREEGRRAVLGEDVVEKIESQRQQSKELRSFAMVAATTGSTRRINSDIARQLHTRGA